MSAQPDWMNFGDDDTTAQNTTAPHAHAQNDFTVDTLPPHNGHASPSNNGHKPAEDDSDIPLFLREDAAALHDHSQHHHHHNMTNDPMQGGGGAAPAFLSGLVGPDEHESAHPHHHQSAGANTLVNAALEDKMSTAISAVMYADQPSAAVVHFDGDSGTTWTLHRVRILGKGNYGCATLYSLDEADTAAPSPRRAVVVKDINVQTMLNPQEDMAAVQNELRVLRSAAGHPNLVQFVDALFDSRPASYPMCFIVMEYAAGGDLAMLLERCGPSSLAGNLHGSPHALSAGADAAAAGDAVVTSTSSSSSPSAPPQQHGHPTTTTTTTTAAAMTSFSMGSGGGGNGARMIPEELIAAYLIQTAVALHSLHTEHGILHRDVKPHNIFLLEDGVTVRLGDFGISMQLGRVGEKAKEACGSPYFMAPEIFEERPYDSGADVWSLGVVFYQLLTHQLPFTASSVGALGTLVRRGQYARLCDVDHGTSSPTSVSSSSSSSAAVAKALIYSKELRELVDSLLTVDPAARPTLRRVLRSRYVREHLRYVPATVLQAKKPMISRASSASAAPRSGSAGRTALGACGAPQFSEEGLYASVFGADVVAEAMARAAYPGVSPVVMRIDSTA